MIINTSHCNFPDKLSVADVEIERVNVFKLLGVHINQSLKWDDHVSAICYKKQLKKRKTTIDSTIRRTHLSDSLTTFPKL